MLYKLIKNPSTNSWFCTYMINKNKHYVMCFFFINSMLQFKSKVGAGHTCLIKKPTSAYLILMMCHPPQAQFVFIYIT
jgi:hypothetical protein